MDLHRWGLSAYIKTMTIRQKHYAWMTIANKLEKERQDMYYYMKVCSQNFDPETVKLSNIYPFNTPTQ